MMQTLSDLLASFPDPPKTLLNANTSAGPSASGAAAAPASAGAAGAAGSGTDPSCAAGAAVGGAGSAVAPMVPAGMAPIAAGGGSAVATGFQEPDMALLERSCREELDNVSQRDVFRKLLSEPVLPVERALDMAYTNARTALLRDLAAAKKKKLEKLEKESPCSAAVFASKHFIDFGSHPTVGRDVTDVLDLTNNTGNKIRYRIVCPPQTGSLNTDAYTLGIAPLDGVVKKKETAHISFQLRTKKPCTVALVVLLLVEGGLKFHIVVKQEVFAQ